jgi:hypothetical protein
LATTAIVVGLTAIPPANAATYDAIGDVTIDRDWQDPNAWSPTGVPQSGDTAEFAVDATYGMIANGTHQLAGLNVLAGNVTLYGTGALGEVHVDYNSSSTVSLRNSNGGTSLTLGSSIGPAVLFTLGGLDMENGTELSVSQGSTFYPEFSSSGAPLCKINGTMVVTGSGSRFLAPSAPMAPLGSYYIGLNNGSGLLAFRNRSIGNQLSGPLLIADDVTPGTGEVDVVGGAQLGLLGNLSMVASHGLTAQTAALYIDGLGSALTQANDDFESATDVRVGSSGGGSATIYVSTALSGGSLSTGFGGLTLGRTGTVIVGSDSTTGTLIANGNVNVFGGLLQVNSGSVFNLAAGKSLTIDGGTADFKSFDITGTTVVFLRGALSYAGDLLVGTGGPLGANLTLDNSRQLGLSGTTSIDIGRTLAITGGALQTGSLVNNGTLALNTGAFATETAILGVGGTLSIGLGGTTRNTQFGAIVATGAVDLAGSLVVTLKSFAPAVGDSFDILDGALSGTFSTLSLPVLAVGRTWDTSNLYTIGVLKVVASAAVPGDYDGNGMVDAADYTVWRDTLGAAITPGSGADGDGDGVVGDADFQVWRDNFGQGTENSAPVPEPCTQTIALISAMTLGAVRARKAARFL